MRWYEKIKVEPEPGDRRIVRRFIWFPTCLHTYKLDVRQWRWLEICKIDQECYWTHNGVFWRNYFWAEE